MLRSSPSICRRPTVNGQPIIILVMALAIQACAPMSVDGARVGASSLGCMMAAVAKEPLAARPDYEAHCIAAGLITLHCSAAEAWLASVGKELSDLVTADENAEWRDLKSDARGIRCARSATTQSALVDCCVN